MSSNKLTSNNKLLSPNSHNNIIQNNNTPIKATTNIHINTNNINTNTNTNNIKNNNIHNFKNPSNPSQTNFLTKHEIKNDSLIQASSIIHNPNKTILYSTNLNHLHSLLALRIDDDVYMHSDIICKYIINKCITSAFDKQENKLRKQKVKDHCYKFIKKLLDFSMNVYMPMGEQDDLVERLNFDEKINENLERKNIQHNFALNYESIYHCKNEYSYITQIKPAPIDSFASSNVKTIKIHSEGAHYFNINDMNTSAMNYFNKSNTQNRKNLISNRGNKRFSTLNNISSPLKFKSVLNMIGNDNNINIINNNTKSPIHINGKTKSPSHSPKKRNTNIGVSGSNTKRIDAIFNYNNTNTEGNTITTSSSKGNNNSIFNTNTNTNTNNNKFSLVLNHKNNTHKRNSTNSNNINSNNFNFNQDSQTESNSNDPMAFYLHNIVPEVQEDLYSTLRLIKLREIKVHAEEDKRKHEQQIKLFKMQQIESIKKEVDCRKFTQDEQGNLINIKEFMPEINEMDFTLPMVNIRNIGDKLDFENIIKQIKKKKREKGGDGGLNTKGSSSINVNVNESNTNGLNTYNDNTIVNSLQNTPTLMNKYEDLINNNITNTNKDTTNPNNKDSNTNNSNYNTIQPKSPQKLTKKRKESQHSKLTEIESKSERNEYERFEKLSFPLAGQNYDIFSPEIGVKIIDGNKQKEGGLKFHEKFGLLSHDDYYNMINEYEVYNKQHLHSNILRNLIEKSRLNTISNSGIDDYSTTSNNNNNLNSNNNNNLNSNNNNLIHNLNTNRNNSYSKNKNNNGIRNQVINSYDFRRNGKNQNVLLPLLKSNNNSRSVLNIKKINLTNNKSKKELRHKLFDVYNSSSNNNKNVYDNNPNNEINKLNLEAIDIQLDMPNNHSTKNKDKNNFNSNTNIFKPNSNILDKYSSVDYFNKNIIKNNDWGEDRVILGNKNKYNFSIVNKINNNQIEKELGSNLMNMKQPRSRLFEHSKDTRRFYEK